MHRERILRTSLQNNEALVADSKTSQSTLFWSTSILELVESVLRPDAGGPPILPDNSDAVFLCIFCLFMFKLFYIYFLEHLNGYLCYYLAWIVLFLLSLGICCV